jgi:hypothetical protein
MWLKKCWPMHQFIHLCIWFMVGIKKKENGGKHTFGTKCKINIGTFSFPGSLACPVA